MTETHVWYVRLDVGVLSEPDKFQKKSRRYVGNLVKVNKVGAGMHSPHPRCK